MDSLDSAIDTIKELEEELRDTKELLDDYKRAYDYIVDAVEGIERDMKYIKLKS